MKAKIVEIFSSIQGEGLWVGRPQVFVRFYGCSLGCKYCDTPLAYSVSTESRIEEASYSNKFIKRSYEYSENELTHIIDKFGISSLAITGGEPLEQADFIQSWLKTIDSRYDILLETNGIEVDGLKKVLPFIHLISMDIKISSATGETEYWEQHEAFIEAAEKNDIFAKIVFNQNISDDEIERLILFMRKYCDLPVIFQPISPVQKKDLSRCLEVFQIFSEKYPKRVRLIPQMHKYLEVL